MPDVTATEVARKFADILDAVEHRGEHFTIVRHGKAVARLEPANSGRGAEVKALFRRHSADRRWREDLEAVRSLVELQDRA